MIPALIWHDIPDPAAVAAARRAEPAAAAVFLCSRFGHRLGLPHTAFLDTCAAGAASYIPAGGNPYGCDVWLLPESEAPHLADYGFAALHWQNTPPQTQLPRPAKPWQQPPPPVAAGHILVAGAGIAGAATAYALARRGLAVTVLEQHRPAQAASGNRQGLLYAKISPHPTVQTQLLLSAYGFSRRLLADHPDSPFWQGCGVLHLNHSPDETGRNAGLAAQTDNRHLYRPVDAAEAQHLAGTGLNGLGGLFWPQGAWIHPPAWTAALLHHPNIRLLTRQKLCRLQAQPQGWLAHTDGAAGRLTLPASHIVFCTGADPLPAPLSRLPLYLIRGQTSRAAAPSDGFGLRCGLSGGSYVSPAFQGQYCFGASFVPHDHGREWREAEDCGNRRALALLAPELEARLGPTQPGHTALRADCHDHLPAVGPLGDAPAMHSHYARLAADRKFPVPGACPYLPGLFANTGHGSRGLSTAPLCAELVAAQILGLPLPLAPPVAAALAPNRLVIRDIHLGRPPVPAGFK